MTCISDKTLQNFAVVGGQQIGPRGFLWENACDQHNIRPLSQGTTFPTKFGLSPAKSQMSLHICAV